MYLLEKHVGPVDIQKQLDNLSAKNIKDLLNRENIKVSHNESKANLINIYMAKLVPDHLKPDYLKPDHLKPANQE